jgi:hypothetical protein
MMYTLKRYYFALFFTILSGLFVLSSCNRKGVCPGTGQVSESQVSPFDPNGDPKKRRGKYDSNGLIQKKENKRLHKK